MKLLRPILSLLIFVIAFAANAQTTQEKFNIIQFSGKVVTEGVNGKITPLPYANIYVKGTSRGTSAAFDGFFSLVAATGDTIVFSIVGFAPVEYAIPDSLDKSLYYWIQIMSQDDVLLPEAVIRPYPSREFFKQELLALDVTEQLDRSYDEYLADELLEEIRYNLPPDGGEAVNLYLRQTAAGYKYAGQIKPQNVFNPLAWKQFIDAWKRGDFKSKKKKKK